MNGHPSSSALSLGRIFGVQVRMHWSLLAILALIVLQLGAGFFPRWHPDWPRSMCWVCAVVASALFLFSVLAHELAHALAARATRTPVRGITLFLFGGIAHLEGEPRGPLAELLIAFVGPLVSLALGAGATAAGFAMLGSGWLDAQAPAIELLLREAGPVPSLLVWLGPVNLALAAFNLLPAYPLDGGRMLRAIFWALSRDYWKATRWAAIGGRAVGALLLALGLFQALQGLIGPGIWVMLLGWFVGHAARASLFEVRLKEALADVPVGRVMHTRFEQVSGAMSVGQLVNDHLLRSDQRAWPVELDGELKGLVVWEDVRRVPQPRWDATALTEIMTPRERLVTLTDDQGAQAALDLMARHDVDQLPVVNGNRLLGVVRRSDLLKWVAQRPRESDHPLGLKPLRH
jgi:Zn-dependent protease